MLTFGDAGWTVCGNSPNYFLNFFKVWKYLKLKSFKKDFFKNEKLEAVMTWLPHCFRTQSKIVNMDSSPRPSLQPPSSPLWVPVTPVVHGNSHFLPQRDFAHNCFINVCSFIRLSPIRPKTTSVLGHLHMTSTQEHSTNIFRMDKGIHGGIGCRVPQRHIIPIG